MSQVKIVFGGEDAGNILLRQPDQHFEFVRTASGFRLQVPVTITLSLPSNKTRLLLTNLKVTFVAIDDAGNQIEIGTATCPASFRTPIKDAPVSLSWDWSLPAFAVYERFRAGKEPRFRLKISGDVQHVVPGDAGMEFGSMPTAFYQLTEIGYSQQVWIETIRGLNLRDFIVVEIPFSADPPTRWEPVWHALMDARDSFEKGGATGWKNSVVSVRHALEQWQKLEKEDQGPGWKGPPTDDLRNRTKEQRIDNIRWHLIQLAHFAAHTRAEEWTRG